MNLEVNTTVTYSNQENSPTRVTHHLGGTRSGKTYAILQWIIVQALQSKQEVTIVRKTIPSLKRTVIKDFKDVMQAMGIYSEAEYNISDRVYTFYNDSTISFISTDDAEKLRGLKSSILWLEEANEIDSESYFQLQIRTTGPIILSYNPTISPYHWLRQMDDCSRYFTTYKSNPYLERTVVRAIEELQRTNPKAWKIYGLGEYTTNEKAVFQFNSVEWIPNESDLVAYGLDYGYSNDPSCLVSVWKHNGEIFLLEHFYEKGLTTSDLDKKLKEIVQGREEIWADSAEPRLNDELYKLGYNIRPVVKGKDSINFGIQVMQNYKINIPKACQNLTNEFYSYEWATDRFGAQLDKPVDYMNHAIDATRYVFMSKLSNVATAKGKYIISVR
jgi:phage terminase large subunit